MNPSSHDKINHSTLNERMATTLARRLIDRLKTFRPIARLDWQLYLLRDWWNSSLRKGTHRFTTPLGFELVTRSHPAYTKMRTESSLLETIRYVLHARL